MSLASDAGARFSLAGIGGRVCYAVVRRRAFDVAPCAGGGVDVIRADGFGASESNVGHAPALANGDVGVLGRVFVANWLAVRLRVEGVGRATTRFVVEGAGSVYRPPVLGAAGSLGAEVLFL